MLLSSHTSQHRGPPRCPPRCGLSCRSLTEVVHQPWPWAVAAHLASVPPHPFLRAWAQPSRLETTIPGPPPHGEGKLCWQPSAQVRMWEALPAPAVFNTLA